MNHVRPFRFFAAILCLGVLSAPPVQAQTPGRSALVARIDTLANATLAAERAPGITLAVLHGSDTLVIRGYGLADVENQVPVTDQSVFRIGSVTKQFTAAAVMKQVEQGRIRLEATVADYLPDYPAPGRAVTIHQLLNHTSGIPSYTDMGPRFWERSRLDLTHDELLELFANEPLQFEPGTRSAYNNSAYYLLGMVLEAVSGESYAEHLQRTLLQPLGLTQTMYCGAAEIIPHRAAGYDVDDGRLVNAAPLSMNQPGAAGALCSTPRDMVRWARALASGRVVSPESYARMTEPTRLTDAQTEPTRLTDAQTEPTRLTDAQTEPTRLTDAQTVPYGYGLALGRLGDANVVEHGGGINGFGSMLAHYPDNDVTVAVVVNGPAGAGRLQQKIARAVLGIPEPVMQDLPVAAAERARYLGTYDLAPALPLQLRIFEQEQRLFAQATGQGPIPLQYQGDHTFSALDGAIRMVFTVEADRADGFTLHQGGTAIEAKRIRP
jgi:D-alanyl-D-alanine carboxypeptidase